MIMRNGLTLCWNLAFLAGSAFGQEVVNGNFELGNVGFTSEAAFVEGGQFSGNFGEYSVRGNPMSANGAWCGADHTSGTGLMLICDGISGSETVAWRQTVPTVPGAVYSFRAWTMNLVCTQSLDDPVIVLRADAAMVAGPLVLPEAPGIWLPIEGMFAATGATTTLEIATTSSAFNGNDFGIDDIELVRQPIPAVSEWGMIILALLLMPVGTIMIARMRRPAMAGA